MHPHVADIEGQIVTGGARADDHHAAFFAYEGRDRKGALWPGCSNTRSGLLPLPVISQIAAPNLRASLNQAAYSGVLTVGICSPAVEFTAVDHAFSAQPHDKIALAFVTDDTNGIGTDHIGQLHGVRAEPARCPPNQYVLPRFQLMGRVSKEHSIGRGQGQRVTGALFPGLMLRTRHELLALHPGKLAERAIRGFIAPDALGRRVHRITAVAVLVIPIVLVAMDDNLVAQLSSG